MTEPEFWNVVDAARAVAERSAELPAKLEDRLSRMPINQIIDYETIFWRLMDASYDKYLWLAAGVICGNCGDDGFDYFRGWLIAQGKQVFERALEDPDSLAELQSLEGNDELPELEQLLYVGRNSFEKKTGQDALEQSLPPYKPPLLKRSEIWDGQLSSLVSLLPKLTRRFPLNREQR